MKPVQTDQTDFTYELSGGTEENDLPCRREAGKVISYWQLHDDERERLDDGDLWFYFWLWWPNFVGVEIKIGERSLLFEDCVLWTVPEGNQIIRGHRWDVVEADIEYLRGGGLVELAVDMMPPPAVSLELRAVE